MRIALVHSRLLWQGGLETRLFSYMNYLRQQGHEVTVIVYKVGDDITLPSGVNLIHINLSLVPKKLRSLVFNRRLARVMRDNEFDFALSLTKTSHQDAVLCPGNHLGFIRATSKTRLTWSDRTDIKLERAAFSQSKVVLAASQMMKNELTLLYGTDPDRIRVLFPPTDGHRFNQDVRRDRAALRTKYGLTEGKKAFAFVSISHWRKGLPLLLEVFKELQDEPYELLIGGVQPVESDLPNVHYAGFTRETQELYAACDYSILPALYEPFGQVVSESLLCGTPVLVSHMVGAREIVGEREGLVIESFDQRDWLAAIRSLKERSFDIAPDFGSRKGILLEDHVKAILDEAQKLQSLQT